MWAPQLPKKKKIKMPPGPENDPGEFQAARSVCFLTGRRCWAWETRFSRLTVTLRCYKQRRPGRALWLLQHASRSKLPEDTGPGHTSCWPGLSLPTPPLFPEAGLASDLPPPSSQPATGSSEAPSNRRGISHLSPLSNASSLECGD